MFDIKLQLLELMLIYFVLFRSITNILTNFGIYKITLLNCVPISIIFERKLIL